LIDDLRTLSLADSGELPLNLQPVSPASLLERTAAGMKPGADQKDITITVEADHALPRILVDPERMAQVLGNIASNALRYTPQGGLIDLSANAANNLVHLRVRDNGSGITPEDLPFVFHRFYRGSKSRQQNGEAGLGLTIAKSLVEVQGGVISVESEPGAGTTFTIRFPKTSA
jgi:signal transduction histidine kinase